ncbi:MAG: hypothetical protein R2851_26395 [Caldilineaceae bacterium]
MRRVLGQFNQTIYNLPDTIVILGIDVPINDAIAVAGGLSGVQLYSIAG